MLGIGGEGGVAVGDGGEGILIYNGQERSAEVGEVYRKASAVPSEWVASSMRLEGRHLKAN